MTISERVKDAWQALSGIEAQARDERGRFTREETPSDQPTRKTAQLPSIMSPYPRANQLLAPKPTAANLRKFAEMPVARRAINLIKDRIAAMDWQIRIRRGYDPSTIENPQERMDALRQSLEDPNTSDSFRTLFEQVLEDILVGGFGAIEMRSTGDPDRPFQLFAVDGAAIQIDPRWGRRSQHPALRLRHRPPRRLASRHRRDHPAPRQRTHLHPPQPAHLERLRPRQAGNCL